MPCSTSEPDYQPFPTKGKLSENLNLPIDKLRQEIGSEQAFVYCYIIATIGNDQGSFVQAGSGPNFQGDLITLCTCKRYMRTFKNSTDWPGAWIAGFSGIQAGQIGNALVYLMKVDHAFCSHHELWSSNVLSIKTKRAKSAKLHKLGDLFQPREEHSGDLFDPQSYYPPCNNHTHIDRDEWHKDIDYIGLRSGRRAALLVGDVEKSYLWDKPLIYHSNRLGRGQRKSHLQELLVQLKGEWQL